MITRTTLLAATALFAVSPLAQGSLLYSEDFKDSPDGKTPVHWSENANWSIVEKSGAYVYVGTDATNSNYFYSRLNFTPIAFPAETATVEFSFDLNVENYRGLAAGAPGTFRITLQPGSSTANRYSIGIGYGNLGSGNTLFFYAGAGASPTPSTSNAIGYSEEGGLAPGFNLGPIGNASHNGTGGNTYRVKLSLNQVSGSVQVTIVNLSDPSQEAVFEDQWQPIQLSSDGSLLFTTGQASMGIMEIGNVEVHSIPEANTMALLGAGVVICGTFILRAKAQ